MLNEECGKWKGMYWAILFMAIGVGGFVAVTADLLWKGQLYQWGGPLRFYFHEHSTPVGVLVCSGISGLGQVVIMVPYGVGVGVFLWMKGWRRATAFWTMGLTGSAGINEVLKHIFKVPRPSTWTFYAFPAHAGYSFPSGHTMGVSIAAGMTVMVARRVGYLSPAGARAAWAGAALLALLVGFSLIYMCVHTLIDVLGGLAVSVAWLAAMRAAMAWEEGEQCKLLAAALGRL